MAWQARVGGGGEAKWGQWELTSFSENSARKRRQERGSGSRKLHPLSKSCACGRHGRPAGTERTEGASSASDSMYWKPEPGLLLRGSAAGAKMMGNNRRPKSTSYRWSSAGRRKAPRNHRSPRISQPPVALWSSVHQMGLRNPQE